MILILALHKRNIFILLREAASYIFSGLVTKKKERFLKLYLSYFFAASLNLLIIEPWEGLPETKIDLQWTDFN